MDQIQDRSIVNFYLNKYGFISPQLDEQPSSELGIIVVIPCYNEPDLISSLESLERCEPTICKVEVIVMLNSSENEENAVLNANDQTKEQFNSWNQNKRLKYHLIHIPDLPKKHAGVGLARKIGMDEAVHRFHQINKDGIIVCFDADSSCDPNYLKSIEDHFEENPKSPGCSIYYEHPIEGDDFDDRVYEGIINYELHLRYYKQCLQYCGLPYAFHTVGSSMAVRSSAYQKQGGMNKRKAGEDFYFIHKIIALGGFTELNNTRVIPSPRSSDRVPFGTGRAIQEYLDQKSNEYPTYDFQIFMEIKKFVDFIPQFNNEEKLEGMNEAFKSFLNDNQFEEKLEEISKNTRDLDSFKKRFFVWFDAFKVLKLVHWMRDHGFDNIPIEQGVINLLELETQNNDLFQLLKYLRSIDKN